MLVRDELIEIDIGALCFDETEARSFLIDVAGLDLQDDDVVDLRNSTDGWVAALQLASLSLRGADTPAELISNISGRHHAIADFLAENVLGALEPEILRFLLTTSITERICGSLASALSGEARGQAMLEEVEMRDLFLRRLDENGDWFRYQDLFAEFLRRRLDRDHPELTTPLHRTASEWFADHHRLVEAVDHALAAGDTPRAVELVETDGPGLLEHSQMSTLLGLVEKLPSDAVVSSLTLQMMLSWAYVLLGRTSLARAALERVDGVLEAMQGAGADVADLRAEARVVEAVVRGMADRTDGIDDLVGECLSRPDTLLPFVVSVAVNAATFAAIARFDFDAAHRWQTWASPYHQQNSGPYTVMYGYALDGIAAFEQLDLARAEGCFRAARQVACKSGAAHGQGARLAGALLAELLYERGGIDEAERLLAESFKLGAEEGIVDMINARFVVGARLAVLRGDRGAAAEHLDQAADIAERLSRPRLLASVQNERVILGLPTRRVVRPPVDFAQRRRPVDGVDEMTAQLEEETAIRLIINESRDEADAACRWAQEWVDRLKGRGRHRASLRAERLLAECLLVVGRAAEAKQLFGAVLARCADLGMVRFPLDGGEQLLSLIAEIRNDHQTGRSESATPQVPMSYLDRLLGAAGRTTTG